MPKKLLGCLIPIGLVAIIIFSCSFHQGIVARTVLHKINRLTNSKTYVGKEKEANEQEVTVCEKCKLILDRVMGAFDLAFIRYLSPDMPPEAAEVNAQVKTFGEVLAQERQSPTKRIKVGDECIFRDKYNIHYVNDHVVGIFCDTPWARLWFDPDAQTYLGGSREVRIHRYSDTGREVYVVEKGRLVFLTICEDGKAVCSCECDYMPNFRGCGGYEPGQNREGQDAEYILNGIYAKDLGP
jgi:hypothetical protein